MRVAEIGFGGVLLRWQSQAAMPDSVDLFSGGVHVLRQPLIRFAAGHSPVRNFFDMEKLVRHIAAIELEDGPADLVGWGLNVGEEWTLTGQDTPFCVREAGRDVRPSRYDVTATGALRAFAPVEGHDYVFRAATAQHRCGMGLAIDWIDAKGKCLRRDENWRETGPWGGRDAADYATLAVSGACPPGAAGVRLLLVQGPPTEGDDGYIFFHRLTFTDGDPEGRTILDGDVAFPDAGAGGVLALLPIGDAMRDFAGPFEVVAGEQRIALDTLPDAPAGSAQAAVLCNGSYLDIALEGALPPHAYVTVDGEMLGFVDLAGQGAQGRVSIRLTAALLEGRERWTEVRDGVSGATLFAGPVEFPALQTPASALQQHTSRMDRPALLPFADLRYAGLAASIERLGRADGIEPWELAQLAACHAYVTRGPQPNQRRFEPLRMKGCEAPRFSIVIPVHDKFHLTYFCIASVLLSCAGLPFEIVVVDDGSSDQTRDIEAICPGVRVVRHEAAQGFVGACNAGAAAAAGSHLVFLNNDTEALGRWLEELYLPFELFADVGETGARLVYPDGRLQEAGGIVWGNGRPWNYGRDGNPADPRFGYTRQADYLSGAAIMVSRAVWDEVGGFAAEYAPAYYEDTDLAFRIRAAGYRTVFAAKAVVVHFEGASNGVELGGEGLKRFQEINRPKFEARWQAAFAEASPEGRAPDLEKDRGVLGRALVLDYQTPRFDADAGSHAISQEIRVLQALGYKVTLATLNAAHLGIYTDTFERAGVEHLHSPFHSSVRDVIERRGGEFDLVYAHRYTTAEGLVGAIRAHAPQAKLVLNCADLHFLRELRAARIAGSQELFERAMRTREAELEVFGSVDAVLSYSEIEKSIIETYLGLRAPVALLPWVASVPEATRPLGQRDGIGFIGSYDHPPNRDAVEHFLSDHWPAIRERDPDVVFHIAGSGFERFAHDGDPRVRVVGWVPSALDFLSARRVMVAPLRSGAGVKGKVIDALSCGTPAVLSAVAAEGLPASAVTATAPDEWAARISLLLADDGLWHRESAAARQQIGRHFSFANAVATFQRIFEELGLPTLPPGERGGLVPLVPVSQIDAMLARAAGPVLPAEARTGLVTAFE